MRAWVNGRLLDDADQPALSVTDHGLTVGDGVFETVKVVGGRPFALGRHLLRLAQSAQGLGLPAPDEAQVREAVAAVLQRGADADGLLRVMLTSGPGPLGSHRHDTEPTLVVMAGDPVRREPTTAVATVPWRRNEYGALTGLKTTSYAENVVALAYAEQRDASEAVFANTAGMLCEGTGSNVFYVVDGELVTPTLDSGCLAGVTRALVLEWCGAVEQDAPVKVLARAEEVFLASTTRNVQPVHRCDRVAKTAPGPVTAKVQRIWAERSAAEVDP